MNDTSVPRPNVATGAVAGFAVVALGLLLTALKTNPTTLEGWLTALQPLIAAAVAYFAPAYQKAWAALIGAGLIPFVLLIVNVAQGAQPFDFLVVFTLAVALVQAAVTALVNNTKAS